MARNREIPKKPVKLSISVPVLSPRQIVNGFRNHFAEMRRATSKPRDRKILVRKLQAILGPEKGRQYVEKLDSGEIFGIGPFDDKKNIVIMPNGFLTDAEVKKLNISYPPTNIT